MDDDHKSRPRAGGRAVFMVAVVVILVLLPLLYVLSIGPYYWLVTNGYFPRGTAAIYEPLDWASDASPSFCRWVRRYLSLFG